MESIIAACDDLTRLKEWALNASDLTDAEFLELLGIDSRRYAWERAEEVQSARDTCATAVRRFRPEVYRLIRNVIDRCDDPEQLRDWTRSAPEMSNDEFFRLINSWDRRWEIY